MKRWQNYALLPLSLLLKVINSTRGFIILIVLGIAAHLLFGLFFNFIDINFWAITSINISMGANLYELAGYYYTPVWGYFLAVTGYLGDLLGISYGTYIPELFSEYQSLSGFDAIASIPYKMLITVFLTCIDLLCSYYIYKILRLLNKSEQEARVFALLWFILPLTIFVSSVRSMNDALMILFLLMGVFYALNREALYAGVFLALSALTKEFTIIPAILLAGYIYRQNRNRMQLIQYTVGLITASIIILLPAILTGHLADSMFWLTNRFPILYTSWPIFLGLFVLACILVAHLSFRLIRSFNQFCWINIILLSLLFLYRSNIQYLLLLVPFLILAYRHKYWIVFLLMGILTILCFIDELPVLVLSYEYSGLPGGNVLDNLGNTLGRIIPWREYYKQIFLVITLLLVTLELLRAQEDFDEVKA